MLKRKHTRASQSCSRETFTFVYSDPPGIDGFFTAFDVSTLPQQIGQGHFALSGCVKAVNGAAKDVAPLSELSSNEAREAREAREAESDMV